MKIRRIKFYLLKLQRLVWQLLDTFDQKLGPGPGDHDLKS